METYTNRISLNALHALIHFIFEAYGCNTSEPMHACSGTLFQVLVLVQQWLIAVRQHV